MNSASDYRSIEEYVAENREMLERIFLHSNDPYARACALTLLDEGSDPPDLHRLQKELDAIKKAT